MKIDTRELTSSSGNSYTIYNMTNSRGLTVSIMDLGAAIQRITLAMENGGNVDLSLGFPEAEPYEQCTCYAGATLGPNAGRIKEAQLPIGPRLCALTKNDGQHQLHGGFRSLAHTIWKVISVIDSLDYAAVTLSATQTDGLDGYPGNRSYTVSYTLEDTNWLSIEYRAVTDTTTYINLSNHTYWNLTGDFSRPALEQELKLYANNVCINETNHLPYNIIPLAGTAFDFRNFRKLSAAVSTARDPLSRQQLTDSNGFNHAYILNKHDVYRKLRTVRHHQTLKKACVLRDKATGRTLKMFTDAPALVVYSGGYLPPALLLHGNTCSAAACAVALEAQDIPDVMHLLPESYVLTTPEQPFSRTIRYHISN